MGFPASAQSDLESDAVRLERSSIFKKPEYVLYIDGKLDAERSVLKLTMQTFMPSDESWGWRAHNSLKRCRNGVHENPGKGLLAEAGFSLR